jgi:hypothetical protein
MILQEITNLDINLHKIQVVSHALEFLYLRSGAILGLLRANYFALQFQDVVVKLRCIIYYYM